MKKWVLLILTMLLSATLLIGCTSNEVAKKEETPQIDQSGDDALVEEAESLFPITITDALGNNVTIEEEPERIVTLIPSLTETVFALGKGDAIVGRTDWCNYPEQVFNIESVGGMDFDVEKVISLKPNVVLSHASGAHSSADGLEQLRNAGITVVVIQDAKTLNEVLEGISIVGKVTGASEKAEEIIADMDATFTRVKEKAAAIKEEDKVTVWIEVSPAPDIYTTGKGTFMNEMLELIQAKNAAGDQEGWIPYTEESAVLLNPDVIVTTYGYYIENPAEQVRARQGWQEVTAIQTNRVYDLHPDKTNRSGPRLAEGVEELASIIYPDIFK